jgi:ATP-binding cassette subfamily B protein
MKSKQSIRLGTLIWHYLRHKKWVLAGFKMIIDTVTKFSGSQVGIVQALMLPAVLYVVLSIIVNLSFRLYEYVNLRLYPDIKAYFDRELLSYVLNHSYGFFQNTFTGTLTQKISDFVVNVEPLISIPNEWAIVFVLVSYWASKGSEHYAGQFSQSIAVLNGSISDSISNVISTKLFDNVPHELSAIDINIQRAVKHDRAWKWYDLKVNFVQGIGVSILISIMLILLLQGVKQGHISAGDFALVLTLSIAFVSSIHNVGHQMQQFFKVVGICNAALSVIREPHGIVDVPHELPLNVTAGEICFKHVDFQYENNHPVFTDLTVTINPGEKVGLVGYSGGGKSTFIKLILRLFDTKKGQIWIDDQNIQLVTQGSLRQQIGTIPQETELFHRTIMQNIRFARVNATDEEVIEAAKKARCHDFIMALPDQYHSLVGERGVKLSGGQKQRIAIARAFLKNAPILLLDEATSSLDSQTEQEIHAALHEVMENKTTLVIAHRLSTLKDMDRILVFVHGQIVEDGSLEQLLANKQGHFYKLWHMQVQGFIPVLGEGA